MIDRQREIREGLGELVDGILVRDALIVLNMDSEKVAAMKDWSPAQIDCHLTLKEASVRNILAFLSENGAVLKTDLIKEVRLVGGTFDELANPFYDTAPLTPE